MLCFRSLFIYALDILAIDFDAKLSGLFRLLLHTKNESYPIIHSHSSSSGISDSSSSLSLSLNDSITIFQDFLSSSSQQPNMVCGESLLKAKNIVELQVWLQYVITVYHQHVSPTVISLQTERTASTNLPTTSSHDRRNSSTTNIINLPNSPKRSVANGSVQSINSERNVEAIAKAEFKRKNSVIL